MFEKLLIKYASPTLGGIKSGNLFKIYLDDNTNLENLISYYNTLLNPFDLYLYSLYKSKTYALIYIYRLEFLIKDFSDLEIISFLKSYNYNPFNIDDCLKKLKSEFETNVKTPHEVGLFLGYPIKDVKGFINNKGKNYKLCGCWKVYDNIDKCAKLFKSYKDCKSRFEFLYSVGYPFETLIYEKKIHRLL